MKTIELKFQIDDVYDEQDALLAIKAPKLRRALEDTAEMLRKYRKYGTEIVDIEELINRIEGEFHEILAEHDVGDL